MVTVTLQYYSDKHAKNMSHRENKIMIHGWWKLFCFFIIISFSPLRNIMAEGFRFIYLAFRFSEDENFSAQCMG